MDISPQYTYTSISSSRAWLTRGFTTNWRDHLFVHEYGHYIQSQQHGYAYLPLIDLPNLTGFFAVDWAFTQTLHDSRRYEAEASSLGVEYFTRFCEGFDRVSFLTGRPSTYFNPRRGRRNNDTFNIIPEFHWTDIVIGGGFGGIINNIFNLLKHF